MSATESRVDQNQAVYWIFILASAIGLYLTTRVNYLLFHSLVELFSIIVAATVFIITWNSLKYIKSPYLIMVGISYLFIGALDLLHTLSYKGMPIFIDYDFYANQLWIAARGMESCTLLVAFLLLTSQRNVKPGHLFSLYLVITAFLVASIFYWKIFPICFIADKGLTPFKVYSEYVICAMLAAGMWLLTRNKSHFAPSVYKLLLLSMICTIISELAFTFYINNYGISNIIGHYFKLFSFMLIYRAIVATGIEEPYQLIFKELHQTNETLHNEIGVRIKTEIELEAEITRCNLIRNSLIESELFFKESQRAASIGSYRTDFVADRWESSEIMDQIFGIDENYTRNVQGWLNIVHPDDREMMDHYLREEVISKRESFSKEYRIICKNDGETRWVLGLGEVKFDEHGVLLTLTGTIQDITTRMKTESALRASEKFTHTVMDTMGCLVVVLDMEGRIERFNPACEVSTGYSAVDVLGRVFWEFLVPEEEMEGIRQTWEHLQAGNYPNNHENHWISKDGTRRLIAWTNTAIEDDRGRLEYIIASGTDITERKQTEEKLRESDLRFRLATEATGVGFWEWNVLTNQISWDHQMFSIYGIPPTADGIVLYSNWSGALLPEELAEQEATLDYTARHGGQSSRRFRIRRRENDEFRDIQAVETVRTNAQGQIEWVVGTNLDITERLQSEKIRAALAAIVESTEDAVIGKCLDGTITSWNPGAELLFGYKANEMIGQSIVRIIPPELVVEETDNLDRLKQGQSITHFETERLAKDGRRISVSMTVSPIRDDSGGIIGVSKIVRDISEHKQAETYRNMGQEILLVLSEYGSLKEAIKRVFEIIKSATGVDAVGIRLQDDDDFPYFYQEGFPEDFLLKENSLLTRTKDGGICRDECGDVCLECTCGLVVSSKTDPSSPLFTKGGSSWTNDSFPFLHAPVDEDIRTNPRNECIHQGFASVALIPIRAKGRVVGLLQLNDRRKGCFTLEGIEALEKIAENIGESMLRKQAEDALQESEVQLRSMADSIPNLAWWANGDGYITWYNKRWYEYTGTTPEQMEGWGWQSVHDPEVLPKVLEKWQATIASGTTFDMTIPLRGADGVFRPFLTRVIPLKDDAGRVQQWFGTNTNVSELEQRVADRTKELNASISLLEIEIREREFAEIKLKEEISERLRATEALREKEHMLILQSRQAAMGEMIGNIAHQWRQPLNVLGLYTQGLSAFYGMPIFNKEFLDDSIAKSMEIIKHMSKTIDDFRDYFKPEKEKTEFSVIEIIKNTLSLLEGNFQNPKIIIEFVEHSNPVIFGYQNEFAQVVLNILNNARDAIIEREIAEARVTITICSGDHCTVVTVADNAGGIPDEIINKVFDPYFTTKGLQLGTGIGLFMSKSIIEKNMRGRLTVRNTAIGAEFRIEVDHETQI